MIKLLEKLEQKYSRYAISNLNFYLTVIFSLGLVIQIFNSDFYYEFLSMNIGLILKGQIWRLITFLFYPPSGSSLLFAILSIYIYYSLTKSLMMTMSDFMFNMFFVIGILLQFIGGLLCYIITKNNLIVTPSYLIFSILIAFCFTFDDAMMLFYFIIPIKAKYIAYIDLIFFIINFIQGSLSTKFSIAAALLNVYFYLYYRKNSYRG